jgi:hypothetical protein
MGSIVGFPIGKWGFNGDFNGDFMGFNGDFMGFDRHFMWTSCEPQR